MVEAMTAVYDQAASRDFHSLDHEQQLHAVRNMARAGLGDHTIASATGLSVEMVRRFLAEQQGEQ